jgi:hypothetical protein
MKDGTVKADGLCDFGLVFAIALHEAIALASGPASGMTRRVHAMLCAALHERLSSDPSTIRDEKASL